jgi:hypothetical protein
MKMASSRQALAIGAIALVVLATGIAGRSRYSCDKETNMARDYKIMVFASGSEIIDLAAVISTYPVFDGLVADVQTPTEKTALQVIAAARPDLQIWLHVTAIEYPFSKAALSTEWWDWVRGNVQFMADSLGAATRARMVVGSEVACFYVYCHAPTEEFQEIYDWPEIDSTIADAMVAKLVAMAAAIGPRCGIFYDQTWMRLHSWQVDTSPPYPCSVVPFQSGHGATNGIGHYAGADYATLNAAFGGANNWREWYDNMSYLMTALDAATPATAWNLHNGELRIDHFVNLDPGFGTYRNQFAPLFIEKAQSNILLAPGYLTTALTIWDDDARNVLGVDYQGQAQYLQDIKTAWVTHPGWVALHGWTATAAGQIAAIEELNAYSLTLVPTPSPSPAPSGSGTGLGVSSSSDSVLRLSGAGMRPGAKRPATPKRGQERPR